jgi:cytoskeletal protein RodZ
MEVLETKESRSKADNQVQFDQAFKPTGAIAFFILLVILGLIIWYSIYFLMLERV